MITQETLEGLSKQNFIYEYLLNGLFPCHSSFTKAIRAKKRPWDFNDKFEYRMFLASSNTGGTLNSQVYNRDVSLAAPGKLDYGIFHATFGTVTDGIDVDLARNLETENAKAAFELEYAQNMHSLRINLTGLFKNFAIHGRFGVVHQIRGVLSAPNTSAAYNPVPNVHTPVLGTPFTIKTPLNVYNSGFKKGKLLIKTKEALPWGEADVSELYLVLDNQPRRLTLLPIGTTVSDWENGQFLEVAQNREIEGQPDTIFGAANWTPNAINISDEDSPFFGKYNRFNGTGSYTHGADAVTGAMEGAADLFPWYTNGDNLNRLGLNLPFRDQRNRLAYTIEQAGSYVVQEEGTSIMDAVMDGVFMTKSVVPEGEIQVWMNPVTRQAIGYEEGTGVTILRDNLVAGPLVYQRGIHEMDFQIGNQVIKDVVEDMNIPTDVILIGPKLDLSYNCWDNAQAEIDKYVQETWGGEIPDAQHIALPKEFVSSLDIGQRITYGPPSLSDGGLASFSYGNNIRHAQNKISVAMHEMGALFTEHPYAYTVVKLAKPYVTPQDYMD